MKNVYPTSFRNETERLTWRYQMKFKDYDSVIYWRNRGKRRGFWLIKDDELYSLGRNGYEGDDILNRWQKEGFPTVPDGIGTIII